VKGNLICVPVDPEGVVPSRRVEEEDVQARHRGNQERNEKMKGEKARKRSVIHGKPPP